MLAPFISDAKDKHPTFIFSVIRSRSCLRRRFHHGCLLHNVERNSFRKRMQQHEKNRQKKKKKSCLRRRFHHGFLLHNVERNSFRKRMQQHEKNRHFFFFFFFFGGGGGGRGCAVYTRNSV